MIELRRAQIPDMFNNALLRFGNVDDSGPSAVRTQDLPDGVREDPDAPDRKFSRAWWARPGPMTLGCATQSAQGDRKTRRQLNPLSPQRCH